MIDQTSLPDLDDPEVYEQTDPQGARQRLFTLAEQCRAAWEIVSSWDPPPLAMPPRAVLVIGMGGSAIGGDLLRVLASPIASIPIIVHRDYDLPAFAGPHTLVIVSTYSGNTEETLSAAKQARQRAAPMVAVTTGGELAHLAWEWDVPRLSFDYPAQPRETLGYSLLLLMGALVRLDLLPDPSPEIEGVIAALEALRSQVEPAVPLAQNPAKELAHWLCGHLPFVCGAGLLGPVARRWKGEFNEVSNAWAVFDQLPEMDHNTVAGTTHPAGFGAKVRAIFLASRYDHPRNRRRQEITSALLEDAGVACRTVAARGDSQLAQVLTSVLFGDATSYYLAILYGADPTLIPQIVALKQAMARVSP